LLRPFDTPSPPAPHHAIPRFESPSFQYRTAMVLGRHMISLPFPCNGSHLIFSFIPSLVVQRSALPLELTNHESLFFLSVDSGDILRRCVLNCYPSGDAVSNRSRSCLRILFPPDEPASISLPSPLFFFADTPSFHILLSSKDSPLGFYFSSGSSHFFLSSFLSHE